MSTRYARWAAAATAVAAAVAGALAALLMTAPVWAAAPAAPTASAPAYPPLAIVTQDQVALRAAPRDAAAQQAVLWQGDVLE
ncbi:MAG TPA: hypothetical protein VIO33_25925, partial [Burkholderiaceae bacterium]